MEWMDHTPPDFIIHFQETDLKIFKTFKHRTFNAIDCVCFLKILQFIYQEFNSLENAFFTSSSKLQMAEHISNLKYGS